MKRQFPLLVTKFLADAKKSNPVIESVPSTEIDRIGADLIKLDPALGCKLADVMK